MHYIDADDYEDKGGGVRWFKESPLPRTVYGKDMGNAMMLEIIGVLNAAGVTPAADGAADESAGWGQLAESINTLIATNGVFTNISSLTVKDDGDVDRGASNIIGKISYHQNVNTVNLALKFDITLSSAVDYLYFDLDSDYHPFGTDLESHPLIPLGVGLHGGGSSWSAIADRFVNCFWTGSAPRFYLGNAQLANLAPTTESFAGGTYKFGINYDFRRAGI